MQISMPRGDMRSVSFSVQDPGQAVFADEFDDIYFTVKKQIKDKTYCFQKRLSSGDIVKTEDGTYEFTIMPEDTDNMCFGEYMFDIELVIVGELKQTFVGKFILTAEVTFAENEG